LSTNRHSYAELSILRVDGICTERLWLRLFTLVFMILLYSNTMGAMAGNFIAAIPVVQPAVKSKIAGGL
jgi:hypothetical protein